MEKISLFEGGVKVKAYQTPEVKVYSIQLEAVIAGGSGGGAGTGNLIQLGGEKLPDTGGGGAGSGDLLPLGADAPAGSDLSIIE